MLLPASLKEQQETAAFPVNKSTYIIIYGALGERQQVRLFVCLTGEDGGRREKETSTQHLFSA